MRKALITLLFVPLLFGCYARSGGIPLFNSYGYNYTPLRGLIEENNLSAPYALNIGQSLKLPKRQKHVVSKGETLYSISKKYNVDITSLSRLNDLEEPYTISVGQTLMLPETLAGSSSSSTQYQIASKTSSGGSSSYSYTKGNTAKKTTTAKNTKSKTTAKKSTATAKSINKKAPRKNVSTYRKTKFIWPVQGTVVSNFGIVGKGRKNDGINIKAAMGTNVKAADKGVVAYAGNELKGFGNLILIKHSDGYITAYAHNQHLYVKKGQKVLRGEKIATVGSTGSVNFPQLHFEVRAGKKAVNPRSYLP